MSLARMPTYDVSYAYMDTLCTHLLVFPPLGTVFNCWLLRPHILAVSTALLAA